MGSRVSYYTNQTMAKLRRLLKMLKVSVKTILIKIWQGIYLITHVLPTGL